MAIGRNPLIVSLPFFFSDHRNQLYCPQHVLILGPVIQQSELETICECFPYVFVHFPEQVVVRTRCALPEGVRSLPHPLTVDGRQRLQHIIWPSWWCQGGDGSQGERSAGLPGCVVCVQAAVFFSTATKQAVCVKAARPTACMCAHEWPRN